jgi:hypothetical protein
MLRHIVAQVRSVGRLARLPLRHRHLLLLSTPLLLGALLGGQDLFQNLLSSPLPVSLGCLQLLGSPELGQLSPGSPYQPRGLEGPGVGTIEPG